MTFQSALKTAPDTNATGAWSLVGCLPPSGMLTTIPVQTPSFVIGRKVSADLQLASHCVSGRHCEILQIGEHLFVRDLGSTNGTFINRRRVIQPTPISAGDHIEIADVEFRLEYSSPSRDYSDTQLLNKTNQVMDAFDSNWILSQFDELMRCRSIQPFYQPIVSLSDEQVIGFEALARSTVCGLESPARLFQAAKTINREVDLSVLCRQRAVECADWMRSVDGLFINTHPMESLTEVVLPCISNLRQCHPRANIVVEVHEGAVQDLNVMREFAKVLRGQGVKIAYDDFGAGQSRLAELTMVPPDYLKFDASLIHDIDKAAPQHRRMLSMLIELAKDSATQVLAEGVETAEEAAVCKELGFDLGQGFYFGRPAPVTEQRRMTTQRMVND